VKEEKGEAQECPNPEAPGVVCKFNLMVSLPQEHAPEDVIRRIDPLPLSINKTSPVGIIGISHNQDSRGGEGCMERYPMGGIVDNPHYVSASINSGGQIFH